MPHTVSRVRTHLTRAVLFIEVAAWRETDAALQHHISTLQYTSTPPARTMNLVELSGNKASPAQVVKLLHKKGTLQSRHNCPNGLAKRSAIIVKLGHRSLRAQSPLGKIRRHSTLKKRSSNAKLYTTSRKNKATFCW